LFVADFDGDKRVDLMCHSYQTGAKDIRLRQVFIQWGSKVTSLVARSSRGRCAQHLRRIRGCVANESGAYLFVTQMLRAKFA
jgi:hypothetical protein